MSKISWLASRDMKATARRKALSMTKGFDPLGWLAYADWFEENEEQKGCNIDWVAHWRRRGQVGVAIQKYLAEPLPTLRVYIADNFILMPEYKKIILNLSLYLIRLPETKNPKDYAKVREYHLNTRCMKKAKYLRNRVFGIADQLPVFLANANDWL